MNDLATYAFVPMTMTSKLSAYESYYQSVGLTDYATVFERNNEKEIEASLCASRMQGWLKASAREIRVLDIGCGLGAFTCRLLDLLFQEIQKDQPKPRVICDLVDINPTAFEHFATGAASLKHCEATVDRQLCLPWQDVAPTQLAAGYDLIIANHTFYGCKCDHNLAQSIVNLLVPTGLALVALVSRKSDLIHMRDEAHIPNNCAEDFEVALNTVFCNYTRVLYDSKFRFDLADSGFLNWFFASGEVALAERDRLISKYALNDAESSYIDNRAAIYIVEGRTS